MTQHEASDYRDEQIDFARLPSFFAQPLREFQQRSVLRWSGVTMRLHLTGRQTEYLHSTEWLLRHRSFFIAERDTINSTY